MLQDAHNCILDYDTNTHFFAVYDGHGGHEVAEYCAQKLPDYIRNTEEYKEGNFKKALTKGFLGMKVFLHFRPLFVFTLLTLLLNCYNHLTTAFVI